MASGCCPKTFTGFCLLDNTPIAITLDNGVVISWTNLVTGVVTPGNPPAGTGVCEVPSTVTVEIAPLTCAKDAVTVCQGATPWTVTGSVELGATTLAALETITVLQGTSPWVVSGTVAATQSGVWTVNVVEPITVDGTIELGATTLAALETITVLQGTSPWVVSGTVASTQSGAWTTGRTWDLGFVTDQVDASGSVIALDAPTLAALETITVLQGTSPWVVSAVDLDTRNLDCLTDSVTICPGVAPIPVSSTTLATEATLARRFGQLGRTTIATTISAAGDNTIITPAAGMSIRLYWIGMSVASAVEVVATVKFGAAGSAKYKWDLGAFMHWETIEGAANEALIVNLTLPVSTNVNITYEEF